MFVLMCGRVIYALLSLDTSKQCNDPFFNATQMSYNTNIFISICNTMNGLVAYFTSSSLTHV